MTSSHAEATGLTAGWLNEYDRHAHLARNSASPAPDVDAALLAPAKYLGGYTDLESTFDVILFHLDRAYSKASDERQRAAVSSLCQEMIHYHVHMLRHEIAFACKQAKRGLLKKIQDWLSEDMPSLAVSLPTFLQNRRDLKAAADVAERISKLWIAYAEYRIQKRELQCDENSLYLNLAGILLKSLHHRCSKSGQFLVEHTFATVKEELLPRVVRYQSVARAIALTRLDRTGDGREYSAHVICRSLSQHRRWDSLIEFMNRREVSALPNLQELRQVALHEFEANQATEQSGGCVLPFLTSAFGVMLSVIFAVVAGLLHLAGVAERNIGMFVVVLSPSVLGVLASMLVVMCRHVRMANDVNRFRAAIGC